MRERMVLTFAIMFMSFWGAAQDCSRAGSSVDCANTTQQSQQQHSGGSEVTTHEVTSATGSDAGSNSDPRMTERYPRYTLRPGDVLDISFEFSPEFNQTASIQPDGFVSLKSVGDLHVAGQALPEVTKTITAAYSQLLNTPVISIVLKEYEKPYFVASGNVMRPGKYELRGDTTLTEAIAIAGGLNDAAKKSQILLFRRINDGWMEATELNVKQMFAKHNLKEDPHLKSGDMIFVPNSRISNFKRYIPAPGVGMSISPRPF